MNINKLQIIFILFVLLSLTNPFLLAKENVKGVDLRLVYSSDFHSEIKPCGCSAQGNLGGILRRATKFSMLKKSHMNTVFVSAGDILDKTDEQNRIKANYMLQGHNYLGLDAILPGERDLAFTLNTLNKNRLPWVLSNKTKTLPFAEYIKRRLDSGKNVLIYGVLEPALVENTKINLLQADKALKKILRKTDAAHDDFIILLVHGLEKFTHQFSDWPLIDVIVRGHLEDVVNQNNQKQIQTNKKHSAILAAGFRGQRIGIADFEIHTETQLLSNQVVPLTSSVPDHPALTNLYESYNNAITQWWNKKTARIKHTIGLQTSYAPETCKACHSVIHKTWLNSKHSKAIDSLTRVDKQNDPECLICHTTGMNKEGGFISSGKTSEHLNVRCEACHGAARQHANYPLANKLPNAFKQCSTCHSKENSPDFSLGKYWSQISHSLSDKTPLHKQSISPVIGEYDLIKPDKEVVNLDSINMLEFFNFYCHRCYVFNSEFNKSHSKLRKAIQHNQIPITFGKKQKPWASLAYIVAKQNGKGDSFKQAMFKVKFEQREDISDKQVVLKISRKFNLDTQVAAAINNADSEEVRKFSEYNDLKKQNKIYATPTLIINDNILVMPKHSANNTNLMVENLLEILKNLQCRQYAICYK